MKRQCDSCAVCIGSGSSSEYRVAGVTFAAVEHEVRITASGTWAVCPQCGKQYCIERAEAYDNGRNKSGTHR